MTSIQENYYYWKQLWKKDTRGTICDAYYYINLTWTRKESFFMHQTMLNNKPQKLHRTKHISFLPKLFYRNLELGEENEWKSSFMCHRVGNKHATLQTKTVNGNKSSFALRFYRKGKKNYTKKAVTKLWHLTCLNHGIDR